MDSGFGTIQNSNVNPAELSKEEYLNKIRVSLFNILIYYFSHLILFSSMIILIQIQLNLNLNKLFQMKQLEMEIIFFAHIILKEIFI